MSVSLPQLCYDVAYFVLPHYVFNEPAKLDGMVLGAPSAAGPYYYVMACLSRKAEPDVEAGKRFHWSHVALDDAHDCLLLEYPAPPPVDFSSLAPGDPAGGVLAPHFSAVVRDTGTGARRYFILGQAPFGGGTTLRAVVWNDEGRMNCNLGPGPMPEREAFLTAVRARVSGEATDVRAITSFRTAPPPKEDQA